MLKKWDIRLFSLGFLVMPTFTVGQTGEPELPDYLDFQMQDYFARTDVDANANGYNLQSSWLGQGNYSEYTNMLKLCLEKKTTDRGSKKDTRVSCDFWWENYFTYKNVKRTHTGADFQVASSDDAHPMVKNIGFGRVCNIRRTGTNGPNGRAAFASVEYLLDSGEPVYANLLHFVSGSFEQHVSGAVPDNFESVSTTSKDICRSPNFITFLAKQQRIAKEGRTGAESTHLHLEFSNKGNGSMFPESKISCTGDNCNADQRVDTYDLDGLSAFYEYGSSTEDSSGNLTRHKSENTQVWFNPDRVITEKKVLLPVFETNEKRTVFGYDTVPLSASLYVNREREDSEATINLSFLKGGFKRKEAYVHNNVAAVSSDCDSNYTANSKADYFHFIPNSCLPSDTLSTERVVEAGDYLTYALVEKNSYKTVGYPVKFSVLAESEIILDNDQNEEGYSRFSIEGTDDNLISNKIPGYFLTADVISHNAKARWHPNRQGRFSISIHVPDDAEMSNVAYQVCPTGSNSCETLVAQEPDNDSWLKLRDENDLIRYFDFSFSGYVELSSRNVSDTLYADAVKFSYHANEVIKLENFLNLPDGAAHKIIRNYMEGSIPSIIPVGSGSNVFLDYQEVDGASRIAISYRGRVTNIDNRTHSVSDGYCTMDFGTWYRTELLFVVGHGILSCEGE